MGPKRSVDTAALDTKDNSQVDGNPFGFDVRTAVGTPAIPLVSIP